MHNFHFDDQYHTYHSCGSCVAPEGQKAVGAPESAGEKSHALPPLPATARSSDLLKSLHSIGLHNATKDYGTCTNFFVLHLTAN